jgi:glycosyltransferase involved in cell wall biosynthesis
MISIVTGTLNRQNLLPDLIDNTVNSDNRIELILVDGGSTDGTIEYIKNLNHSNIKLIEVGERSSYPHFMNLGIQNSSYDLICQWNDDVLLVNTWGEVIDEISNDYDFYLFDWKFGTKDDMKNHRWLSGEDSSHPNKGWCLLNNIENPDPVTGNNEIVMNYGIYKKQIFKKIGLYNNDYHYYGADADMALRAYHFGYKVKDLRNIKVCTLPVDKRAILYPNEMEIFNKNKNFYENKILPESIKFLI